jgi:polysaccharide pyruvyl transferase WcaK-like protein
MSPRVLLVGNSSYRNKGCEAIVRGTMAILGRALPEGFEAKAGLWESPETAREQGAKETDVHIKETFSLEEVPDRFTALWFAWQAWTRFRIDPLRLRSPLRRYSRWATAALEIGGDLYTLDYGFPTRFFDVDQYLQQHRIPVILWGASVGPFDAEPDFAEVALRHLQTLDGIFVRESDSLEYLQERGLDKILHYHPDPAFAMSPVRPNEDIVGFVGEGAIGINLSPLMAKYFSKSTVNSWEMTEEDVKPWRRFCGAVLEMIVRSSGRKLLLIPHVVSSNAAVDDYRFLLNLSGDVKNSLGCDVYCLPAGLTAAETKWCISRCSLFVGARTHSLIAALSSGVPTFSLSYSRKTRGINRDVFGNLDLCLDGGELTLEGFAERFDDFRRRELDLKMRFKEILPDLLAKTFGAGLELAQII